MKLCSSCTTPSISSVSTIIIVSAGGGTVPTVNGEEVPLDEEAEVSEVEVEVVQEVVEEDAEVDQEIARGVVVVTAPIAVVVPQACRPVVIEVVGAPVVVTDLLRLGKVAVVMLLGQLSPLSLSASWFKGGIATSGDGAIAEEAGTSAMMCSLRSARACALLGVLSRPLPSSPSRSSSSTVVLLGAIIAAGTRPGSRRGGLSRLCSRGGRASGCV